MISGLEREREQERDIQSYQIMTLECNNYDTHGGEGGGTQRGFNGAFTNSPTHQRAGDERCELI